MRKKYHYIKVRTLRGSENYNASLFEDQILEVFVMFNDGYTQDAIAEKVGTPQSNVSRILRRKQWKHVEVPKHLIPIQYIPKGGFRTRLKIRGT
jgi:hypothetical protein